MVYQNNPKTSQVLPLQHEKYRYYIANEAAPAAMTAAS